MELDSERNVYIGKLRELVTDYTGPLGGGINEVINALELSPEEISVFNNYFVKPGELQGEAEIIRQTRDLNQNQYKPEDVLSTMTTYKQVILARQDLKLPKGKLAAQCSHASVEAVLKSEKSVVDEWRSKGMAKIVLKVKDERELTRYFQLAKDEGLSASLITDAGRTVIAPGTKTCVGIGPDEEELIDKITGDLSLL